MQSHADAMVDSHLFCKSRTPVARDPLLMSLTTAFTATYNSFKSSYQIPRNGSCSFENRS